MCGIAGVLDRRGNPVDRTVVAAMLEPLARRGPDGEGLLADGPLLLGHRRLAVLDLTDAARQPMESPGGRYVASFNGEIYNFRDLQQECRLGPDDLRSRSDTEVLLAAWERWGDECLPRLVGQFAFALFDRAERRLWLVRDRFGEKPLFYHQSDRALVFASSLQAVLKAPWIRAELDDAALAEFLTLRYVVSPNTLLRGVRKLAPGHLLCADPAGVRIRRWWSPQYHYRQDPLPSLRWSALAEEFGALLEQACRRCAVSDVPVALLLSDGIDSNSILAVLRATGHDCPSFSFRPIYTREHGNGPLQPSPEDPVHNEVLAVHPLQFLEKLEEALAGFTEPVGDGSSLATWHLIRNARSRATVFLCGHGGDEVLGGYRLSQERFRLAALHHLCRLPGPWLDLVVERYAYGALPLAARKRELVGAAARQVPAAARYLIHRPLPLEELRILFGGREVPGTYLGSVDRLYGECADQSADLDAMQQVLMRTFLSENILTFADSVAMDSSAELRMPFLDRDLVDFVLRLPPRFRASPWPGHANTKLILRRWGRAHLPAAVLTRKKRTFNFGNIRFLLEHGGDGLRDMITGIGALKDRLPGLSSLLCRPPDTIRGPSEGTLWALLSLAVWARKVELH
ncbi:MAG TPA: asparagine synthase (glutamine-hydrolyzing) [Candidatus Polarisedimenticolia bacterium]|nr:asparagine synthase (glutamine-hydrolyzing) [Candidatus Polarisedimenticolia bacterium]